MQHFVEFDKTLSWCPWAGCDLCIMLPEVVALDVFCDCGHGFCFKCKEGAHVPLDCKSRELFNEKMNSESGVSDDNELWRKVNTKKCPKCNIDIQKNAGCMHMTCSQCKYDFCWLCQGDYRKHYEETGIGLCNNFNDLKKTKRVKKAEVEERVRLDRKMRRFAHYATRYSEHLKSVEYVQTRGDTIKE